MRVGDLRLIIKWRDLQSDCEEWKNPFGVFITKRLRRKHNKWNLLVQLTVSHLISLLYFDDIHFFLRLRYVSLYLEKKSMIQCLAFSLPACFTSIPPFSLLWHPPSAAVVYFFMASLNKLLDPLLQNPTATIKTLLVLYLLATLL